MPYRNIVFVKLEKRLLNDHRWYMMSEPAQLIYIKIILLAAETYNKIPKNDVILKEALRSRQEIKTFQECIKEIRTNYPKFKENKHFYYFDEFDTKTNYIPKKEIPRKSQGLPKDGVDKEEEKEEDKDKEKIKIAFISLWNKYPNKVGKKEALRHYETSVKTEEDIALINKALENYLKSERVAKGFIQNASTWFNDWRTWLEYKEEICLKCKGSGIWTSTTGYENICSCPAGLRKRGKI